MCLQGMLGPKNICMWVSGKIQTPRKTLAASPSDKEIDLSSSQINYLCSLSLNRKLTASYYTAKNDRRKIEEDLGAIVKDFLEKKPKGRL